MADTQTVQTMNSLFKQVYADNVKDLVPDFEELMKTISFVSNSQKNGGYYNQPVLLSRDHGVTFLGEDDSNLTLEAPVVRTSANASVRASALMMRTYLSSVAASRAVKGPRAFVDGTRYVVESLVKSFSAIQEGVHWYGRQGYGKGTLGVGDTVAKVLTIDAAEFAEALWIGGVNMPVDLYVGAVKKATTTITDVDMKNRKLTFAAMGALADGEVVTVFRKNSYGVESYGLQAIMANTGSIFGIDASAVGNDLWLTNQYAVGGSLNFSHISESVALAQGRGLQGSLTGFVHPLAFRSLIPDYNTLKDTGADFKSRSMNEGETTNLVHGAKTIKFYVNSVEVEMKSTVYCKRGYGMLINPDSFMRVGSTAPTFNMPGLPDGEYWRMKEDLAALELRMFSDEALLCAEPASNIYLSGIVV